MTWTWTEVISLALVRSGVVGEGQIINANHLSSGMKALNLVLDRLDGKGLALPSFTSAITFSTVAGTAKYTLGPSGTASVRPETIITATCTIATNPVTKNTMVYMDYEDYQQIPSPASVTGQPWNYAINQLWPQMEIFLYPTPSAVYPIILTCKIKWIDTVGAPDLNPFTIAQVPSGYADALVSLVSLELAEIYRLETATLTNKAANARFLIAEAVYTQQRDALQTLPMGLFPWNIGISGRNP